MGNIWFVTETDSDNKLIAYIHTDNYEAARKWIEYRAGSYNDQNKFDLPEDFAWYGGMKAYTNNLNWEIVQPEVASEIYTRHIR